MKKINWIIFLLLSSFVASATEGFYVSGGLLPTYGSGSGDAKSSLFGTGIAASGGLRLGPGAYEIGAKQIRITNDQIGDDDYDTEIKDTVFFGGLRLFLGGSFSLKAGANLHKFQMDISKNGRQQENEEDNETFFGLYGGMGINHSLSQGLDLYFESTLYPIPNADLFLIDMEIGVRFYL